MITKDKIVYLWIAFGILILICALLVLLLAYSWQKNEATITETNTPTTDSELIEEESGFSPEIKQRPIEVDYAEIIKQYEGRRIQIENCVMNPYRVTYKNGTKIMLDNRSPDPLEVLINGQTVRLSDYEYKIITLSSRTLPHTFDVDCTTQGQPAYNVAEILLQR